MPRQAGFQLEQNFTKGLITEATGLNFPENACTETYDCVFSEKGHVTRRFGFDYEVNHENDVINLDDGAITEYLWNAAGGDGQTNIVVVQVGGTLHYYVSSNTASLSSGHIADTTNLLARKVGSSTDAQVKEDVCQFASGNGFLFVTHPHCEPFYVEYTAPATVTETTITIKCRDLEGAKADANYDNHTRPATLSDEHEYNLYNQGWADDVIRAGPTLQNPVVYWDAVRTDFPSNCDIWWLYKDVNGRMNETEIDKFAVGNSPAPKGHFILTEFNTERSTIHADIGTVAERTAGNNRPSTVAFFASRVWYAGVKAQEYNQKIYYSQQIEGTHNFARCYQANDPTSSELADLLPTDGGFIIIPDVGEVIKLFPMASSLLVFATNGVWSISGSEGIGFKATDYSIRKISSVECESPLSFTDLYGTPVWWNTDGIFTLGGSDVAASETVTSLSDTTIKEFYLDIPSDSKRYAKGAFNSRTKTIQWLYRSTAPTTIEERYTYNRVLNLNILSKAFFPWTIQSDASSPTVHGIIVSKGATGETQEIDVEAADADLIVDGDGNQVTVTQFTELTASISFRYLTADNTSATEWDVTWAQTRSTAYVDWANESENLPYESYFFTGYKVHGDGIRYFENNYITITMTTEGNASCFIQGVWDYANSPANARFTNAQQVYTTRTSRDIQQTRKKIRGRGRSLQYKFYSEAGKPFTIHGWSAWETQNASV